MRLTSLLWCVRTKIYDLRLLNWTTKRHGRNWMELAQRRPSNYANVSVQKCGVRWRRRNFTGMLEESQKENVIGLCHEPDKSFTACQILNPTIAENGDKIISSLVIMLYAFYKSMHLKLGKPFGIYGSTPRQELSMTIFTKTSSSMTKWILSFFIESGTYPIDLPEATCWSDIFALWFEKTRSAADGPNLAGQRLVMIEGFNAFFLFLCV